MVPLPQRRRADARDADRGRRARAAGPGGHDQGRRDHAASVVRAASTTSSARSTRASRPPARTRSSTRSSGPSRTRRACGWSATCPVGTLLSGGLDSSLVTAMAARHSRDLTAFHVSVAGFPDLDERRFAEQLARKLEIPLVPFELTGENFRRALPRVTDLSDLPLTHPNSVAYYLISKVAREHGVIVLLSGRRRRRAVRRLPLGLPAHPLAAPAPADPAPAAEAAPRDRPARRSMPTPACR